MGECLLESTGSSLSNVRIGGHGKGPQMERSVDEMVDVLCYTGRRRDIRPAWLISCLVSAHTRLKDMGEHIEK